MLGVAAEGGSGRWGGLETDLSAGESFELADKFVLASPRGDLAEVVVGSLIV